MPVVFDVLSPWPVVSTLVGYLGVGDLLNLSRSNSDCRAILHGFPPSYIQDGLPSPSSSEPVDDELSGSVRKDLYIGEHQTPQWKVLKGMARMCCAEPNHKKGIDPKPCLYCSMPVCEPCIIRESFARKKSLYRTRTRRLCAKCWDTGNSLSRSRFTYARHIRIPREPVTGDGGLDFCNCMAKGGWVCSKCRDIQCDDSNVSNTNCLGKGCSNLLGEQSDRRRICLWCDMPLFGGQNMVNRWGSYGRRRTVSGSQCSRPPTPRDEDVILETADDDDIVTSPEDAEQRDLYLRAVSSLGAD